MKNILNRNFSEYEIVNYILMTTVTLMPLIVVKGIYYPLMGGKLIYLWVVGFLLALYFLYRIRNFNYKLEEKVMFIFITSLIVATLKSSLPMNSLLGEDGWEQGLIMYAIYLVFFMIAINMFKVIKSKINIICFASSLMGIHTILQFYGIDVITEYYLELDGKVDMIGTIGNRNLVAIYMVIFTLIAISAYIFIGEKKYLVYSSILFGALLATLTRGGWVGLAVALIVGFLLIIKEKKYYKRIGIIVCLFIGIFIVMNFTNDNILVDRSKTIVHDAKNIKDEDSGSGRIGIWKAALECIETDPLFGSGIDSMRIKAIINNIDGTMNYPKAHNEFLDYAVWGGLFTLISYLALIGIILKKLFDIRHDNMAKAFIVVIVGYLAQSFFSISVIEVAPIYWIILGAAVGYYRKVGKEKAIKVNLNQESY